MAEVARPQKNAPHNGGVRIYFLKVIYSVLLCIGHYGTTRAVENKVSTGMIKKIIEPPIIHYHFSYTTQDSQQTLLQ